LREISRGETTTARIPAALSARCSPAGSLASLIVTFTVPSLRG
jgi:hypothetical protein